MIILTVFCISCSSPITKDQKDSLIDLEIKKRSWEKVSKLFNTAADKILVIRSFKTTPLQPETPCEYFVYDLNNNKILYEENLTKGTVEWVTNNQIKINLHPGIVTNDETENKKLSGYIIDVTKDTKTEK